MMRITTNNLRKAKFARRNKEYAFIDEHTWNMVASFLDYEESIVVAHVCKLSREAYKTLITHDHKGSYLILMAQLGVRGMMKMMLRSTLCTTRDVFTYALREALYFGNDVVADMLIKDGRADLDFCFDEDYPIYTARLHEINISKKNVADYPCSKLSEPANCASWTPGLPNRPPERIIEGTHYDALSSTAYAFSHKSVDKRALNRITCSLLKAKRWSYGSRSHFVKACIHLLYLSTVKKLKLEYITILRVIPLVYSNKPVFDYLFNRGLDIHRDHDYDVFIKTLEKNPSAVPEIVKTLIEHNWTQVPNPYMDRFKNTLFDILVVMEDTDTIRLMCAGCSIDPLMHIEQILRASPKFMDFLFQDICHSLSVGNTDHALLRGLQTDGGGPKMLATLYKGSIHNAAVYQLLQCAREHNLLEKWFENIIFDYFDEHTNKETDIVISMLRYNDWDPSGPSIKFLKKVHKDVLSQCSYMHRGSLMCIETILSLVLVDKRVLAGLSKSPEDLDMAQEILEVIPIENVWVSENWKNRIHGPEFGLDVVVKRLLNVMRSKHN